MKGKYEIQVTNHESRTRIGSALILAVVLTSLLAIVGVMFLMVARVDRMATSGISENKELNFAVETVIAKISQELVLDVPGAVDPNQEYYDYPDSANRWLASLEPYYVGPGDYRWMRISDIYDRFGPQGLGLPAGIINDYQSSTDVGDSNGYIPVFYPADADGDGVSDSMWVELLDMTSSKGKPIFAAIRIVDNGGMLNVNTAYKFDPYDPNVTVFDIDGSSQMQINLAALSQRGANGTLVTAANKLQAWRCGIMPTDLSLYEQNVVWRYNEPNGPYTPFDISDDLELRSRFLVNHEDMRTRIERLWTWSFNSPTELNTPVDSGGIELDRWFYRTQHNVPGPNDIYSYRHIGTTYNMDRIINPNGEKMLNVNDPIVSVAFLYGAIRAGLYDADPNFVGADDIAAQMAANLKDYSDNDANVSTIDPPPAGGNIYYGFERPCIYISELAHNFVPDPNDPNTVYRSYAIELYKPYSEDAVTADWRIDVDGASIDIGSWPQTKDFYVIQNQDPNGVAILDVNSNSAAVQDSTGLVFGGNSQIRLQRFVADVNDYIVVDYRQVPDLVGDWLAEDGNDHSIRRDITLHKCIRRLWSGPLVDSTLGQSNNYPPDPDPDPNMIQAHPANVDFTNIGEIGIVFCKSAYPESVDVIGPSDTEKDVRIDVNAPIFQQIFNYLTVFDPVAYPWNDPNETRIKGRININTAPWFVIAQLPWMRYNAVGYDYLRAQAIVADRDLAGAFKSIGELMRVPAMRSLDLDASDNLNSDVANPGPDFTDDSATNDFEERDLIFARISNLITVRGDVFTAYILVRIGVDGPQKRVIAILDRSNVYSGSDKVRIVALHPVPDPR